MFVSVSRFKRVARLAATATLLPMAVVSPPAIAQTDKPNILIIMGDDIGQFNISAYNNGMMGYAYPT